MCLLFFFTQNIVFKQLNDFLNSNSTLEKCQSGFRAHQNTETALVKVVNDLTTNLVAKKRPVLELLDLSATFDMVDHSVLLDRQVGLSNTVLN